MSKKLILCFTLLFAVAMVGAGFAQSSLTSAARTAAGVDPESGTPVRIPGPQATHAIPTDLIEDDDVVSSSIKGNPGGFPGIISVPNFTRSFTLPTHVDPEKAAASFKDGVLTVEFPKKEEAKPRQIEIKAR